MKSNNGNETQGQGFKKEVKYTVPPAEPKAYPSGDMEKILNVVQYHQQHKFFLKMRLRIENSRRSRVIQILGFNTTDKFKDDGSLKVQFERAEKIVVHMMKYRTPPDPTEKKFAFLKDLSERVLNMLREEDLQNFLDNTLVAVTPYNEEQIKAISSNLEKAVKQLPIYRHWIKQPENPQRCGVGAGNIGHIIGEMHDLADFGTVGKMWKYLGLAVIDGQRQRYVKDAIEATQIQRYVGRRRAIVWNMEGNIIKAQGARIRLDTDDKNKAPTGPRRNMGTAKYHYFRIYEDRKAYELETHPELKDFDPKTKRGGAKHIANRAQRYMGKRVLEDLWVAWHDVYGLDVPGTWEERNAELIEV